MKRIVGERYRNVYARGYNDAMGDATMALVRLLVEGGHIAVQPFTNTLLVAAPGNLEGTPWTLYSIGALLRGGEHRTRDRQ